MPGSVELSRQTDPTGGKLRFRCKEHYHDMDQWLAKHEPLTLIRARKGTAMHGRMDNLRCKQAKPQPYETWVEGHTHDARAVNQTDRTDRVASQNTRQRLTRVWR